MIKNGYFLRIENGVVQNQGYLEKINIKAKDQVKGHFYSWWDGGENSDVYATIDFLDDCILFSSDYDMRSCTESKCKKIEFAKFIGKNVEHCLSGLLFDVDKYTDEQLIAVASDIAIKLNRNGMSVDEIQEQIMSDIKKG